MSPLPVTIDSVGGGEPVVESVLEGDNSVSAERPVSRSEQPAPQNDGGAPLESERELLPNNQPEPRNRRQAPPPTDDETDALFE